VETVVFVNKWLHLLSMIGTLGGMAFAWLVLRPATTTVGYTDQQRLTPLWRAFGMSLGVFWMIAIITGLLNYHFVMKSVNEEYNMLLAVKVVMVGVMFALSAISARPIRGQRSVAPGKVLGVLLVLGIAVVGISARLNMSRVNGTGLKQFPGATSVQQAR
jgi:uncharacterized membrane protein